MYTGCITFKPLGSTHLEQSASQNPSVPEFRGFPCSMKKMYSLASQVSRPSVSSRRVLKRPGQLHLTRLTSIATTAMVSSLTLENVVEEMFSGPPLYALLRNIYHTSDNQISPDDAIDEGVAIITTSPEISRNRIYSQLRERLAEAADGSRAFDFRAFAECSRRL